MCNTSGRRRDVCPRTGLLVRGLSAVRGVFVSPATAKTAAARLGREAVTIRQWARRYSVRVLGRHGREVVYDFDDLATIEGCIWRGDPVPSSPGARDELRARLARAA